MQKLIYWLVRRHLKLKIGEPFRFTNQKTRAIYRFTKTSLYKSYPEPILNANGEEIGIVWNRRPAGVSLNWLLDPGCKIYILSPDEVIDEILETTSYKEGQTDGYLSVI